MLTKQANILDWPKPSLEPAIWNEDNTLKPEIKKFITDFIHSFAQANNFKDTSAWITDVKFVGSLTTNCWNTNSDMDIHIVVDLPKFVEVEHPEMSEQEASDYLDEIRKQVDQVKAKVPETEHPTEIYFETEFTTHASQEFSGTYSVLQDKWLTEPHIVGEDFDISTLHPDLLNLAKETASELDAAFGELKRDVQDIKELEETIADWPPEQRELLEKKLQKQLDELEKDIKELVDLREDVAEKRKHYKALSEQEVRFKYLQKYFYMHVLTDLKTLLKQSPELSTKDIPVVENIMSQASLKEADMDWFGEGYWLAPDGKEFALKQGQEHAPWLHINENFILKQYGIDLNQLNSFTELLAQGWSRIRIWPNGNVSVEVYSLSNVPKAVDDFIIEHPVKGVIVDDSKQQVEFPYEEAVTGIQKAVNKALQQKRMSTASRHEDSAEGRICIDFDETIAEDKHNGTIGQPEPNAKAALEKLKADGWYIIIYSHRSTTEYGEDQIKEFMDKNDLPYDEIYTEKPNAEFFIDDRAITFTTWEDVLEKVETEHLPEKEANLNIEAYEKKIFQDPTEDQANQLLENSKAKMLRWAIAYDGHLYMWDAYYMDHPMARSKLGINWDLKDSGYYGERIYPTQPLAQYWKNKTIPVYAALNLPTIDPKTLHRKEPYALFIGTQKFPPDIAIDLFDVFGQHPMITESNQVPTVTLETLIKENIPVIGKAPRAGDKQPAQDLSGVVKTAAFPAGNWAESAWISPSGEVFNLEGDSHTDAIYELIDDPNSKIYDAEDPNTYAINKGWTRFGEMGGGGETGANVKSLRSINPAVFNHAMKYTGQNKEMVVADLSGAYIHMPVDEFVLGQKAVDKALQQKRMTTAQLGSEYDFSSTHFLLPKEIAEKIIRWAVETIPEEEIVHDSKDPGTKGIQLESHITLKYGLKTNNFEEVKKALEGEKTPHIKFGKTSFFEPEGKDYDVVIIPVESEELQKLNEKLCSQVEHEDLQFKEYYPHVTVAYVKRGKGKEFDGKDIITGEELDLEIVTFSPKNGEKRELELGKNNKIASSNIYKVPNPYDKNKPETLVYSNLTKDQIVNIFHNTPFGLRYAILTNGETVFWDGSKLNHFDALRGIGHDERTEDGKIRNEKELQQFISEHYGNTEKESSFMPSNTDLAPSNDWTGEVGWPGNEEMDNVWPRDDGENYYSPMDDRPREKSVWWKLLNMFKKQKPLAKKDIVPVKEAANELSRDIELRKSHDFDFGGFKNRRFAYNPKTDEMVFGKDNILSKENFSSHAEEIADSGARGSFDDFIRGWVGFSKQYRNGIIHFAPPITEEAMKDPEMADAALKTLQAFQRAGAKSSTVLRNFVKMGEHTLGEILPSLTQPKEIPVTSKQWTTPTEHVNQPGMDWGWADYIYNYVDETWQDLLHDWLNLDPKNYVKPVVIIEQIYKDEGAVSAWVHIEFINTAGISDAYMKLVITGDVHYEPSYEPEGVDTVESLEDIEIEVLDYGKSDELEKTSQSYTTGMCDAFSLALHELTGFPLAVIRGIYEKDEEGTEPFVDAHAFVLINKNEGIDSLGKRPIKQMVSQAVWDQTPKKIKIVKVSPEDLEFSFGTCDIQDVEQAKKVIQEDPQKYGVTNKESSYGPTNYKGPSTPDHDYQNSAWDGMNVTLSDEEDEKFLDQNGADGYPNRWMGRHRGPYYTNEGKVVKMLEETSALENEPAILLNDGTVVIDPSARTHVEIIENKNLPLSEVKDSGWLVGGKFRSGGDMSDAIRYIEREQAKERVQQKRLQRGAKLSKKAAISGQTVNTILKLIEQNGGATYNLSKGNLIGTDVFAVAIYPDREQIVDGVDYNRIEEYLVSNEDLLSNSNNSFGAWVSGGKTYLDVVATIKDKNQAIQLGLKHKQLAIFDLKNLVEIPLQRVASLKQAGRYTEEAYWVDPSGIIYPVREGGGIKTHMGWIRRNMQLLKEKYPDVSLQSVEDASYDMLALGWIKIGDAYGGPGGTGRYLIETEFPESLPSAVIDWAYKTLKDGDVVEIGHPSGDFFEVTWPVKDLQKEVIRRLRTEHFGKQAAAVSDREQQKYYDEIYSDRWRDDSSPIDGGNEYYDWSELGSNDYPNPKDEEKEHVYMDLLEDPAKANFPAGLPEYWVTFYDANPDQGDQGGI